MPKRKRSSKPKGSLKKRRLFRPRYRLRRGRRVNVVRGRGPVAQTTVVRLKYCQYVKSNGTLLGSQISLNSIYDPDATGTGHQPYGHDTYETLYNRYRVNKVKYIVRMWTSQNATKGIVVANNSTSNYTAYDLAAESPNAITKLVNPYTAGTVFRGYYVPRLITGVNRAEYKDDKYSATFGASPAEAIRMHILWGGIDNSIPAADTCYAYITLIYHCEMFDPKELAQS